MPKTGRIELHHRTVGENFAQMKEALLPAEINNSHSARWVMDYDELIKRQTDREFDRHDDWASSREMIGYFTASILQSRIPFYFASLFHIGRQWKISEAAISDCSLLLLDENLSQSSLNLVEILQDSEKDSGFLSKTNIQRILRQQCNLGIQRQRDNLESAKAWWKTWQGEVSAYQILVGSIQEDASREGNRERESERWIQPLMRLVLLSSKPSALQASMIKDGVRFKAEAIVAPNSSLQFLSFLSLLGLSSLMRLDADHAWRYYARENINGLHNLVYEMNAFLRESISFPDVESALGKLRSKYGDSDPFEQYKAGQNAPTIELLRLIGENKLPNRRMSMWYENWISTLDDEPPIWNEFPKSTKPLGVILAWAIPSADSTIKRNLTDSRKPAESWDEFIQRLFENEWIEDLGYMMGKQNKSSSSSSLKWNHSEFIELVAKVVEKLNEIGYSLVSPTSSRLITLLDKAASEENVLGTHAW